VPDRVTSVPGVTSPLQPGTPLLVLVIVNELAAKENEQPPLEARQPFAKLTLELGTSAPLVRLIDPREEPGRAVSVLLFANVTLVIAVVNDKTPPAVETVASVLNQVIMSLEVLSARAASGNASTARATIATALPLTFMTKRLRG